MFRSNGLSSRNTNESMPMLRMLCMRRMLSALLSQFAINTAMSSTLSTISGFFSNTSLAFLSSFFEHTASMIPRSFSFFIHSWNSVNALPMPNPWPICTFSQPSSPTIPPHRVLSKSNTRHFLNLPHKLHKTSITLDATNGRMSRLSNISVLM